MRDFLLSRLEVEPTFLATILNCFHDFSDGQCVVRNHEIEKKDFRKSDSELPGFGLPGDFELSLKGRLPLAQSRSCALCKKLRKYNCRK